MHPFIQIGILLMFALSGEIISALLPITFPGSLIGMILLFFALQFNLVKSAWIKDASGFLLQNMAFFFLPSAVNILSAYPAVKGMVFLLLIICIVSTMVTFLTTYAVTVLFLKKNKERENEQ